MFPEHLRRLATQIDKLTIAAEKKSKELKEN